MKRSRIGLAAFGLAASAVVGALLWPHAREATAMLAAQDDPAVLADLQLSSAVRNNADIVGRNVEAALTAGDADLANSFAELASQNGIPLSDELAQRVSGAVAEQTSSAHYAKRFVTGLVTGDADD